MLNRNPYMLTHLCRAGIAAGIDVDVRQVFADAMDWADGIADVVVSTAVLCSVRDQAKTLKEIRRVLKPGGQFVFLEHVGAGRATALRGLQRLIRPVWSCVVDGCDPVRDTGEAILKAGFQMKRVEKFKLPLGPIAPHIGGVALS